jgi:peroxiredoxin
MIETPRSNVGLPLGTRIPSFRAVDQNGNVQTFDSIRGPNGAVIYFYRSASWCIYCRAQLVETEHARAALARNGLGLVGISYDAPDVLKEFSDEKSIGFPLLSDVESAIIRAFDILDATVLPGNTAYGVPFHGNYIVDHDGIVIAKLFDAEATLSHSTGVVVSRLFGSPVNTHVSSVTHERLSLTYWASANTVAPGDEIDLTIEVAMNDKTHVYAPSALRNIPVAWTIDGGPAFQARPVSFPKPRSMAGGDGDDVDIYEGVFRLSRRVLIGDDPTAVDAQGNLVLKGTLAYQACDDDRCYNPTSIALQWKLGRAPTDLSHAHRAP